MPPAAGVAEAQEAALEVAVAAADEEVASTGRGCRQRPRRSSPSFGSSFHRRRRRNYVGCFLRPPASRTQLRPYSMDTLSERAGATERGSSIACKRV